MSETVQTLHELTAASSTALSIIVCFPSVLLLIQNDEDSQRLVELYHQYKRLMFKVAQQYFPHDHHEMEDVISDAILKMIDNFSTLSAVPCNKTASYIVKIVRSVCNDRLRKRNRQRSDLSLWDAEDNLADVEDVNASNETALSRFFAVDLLQSFGQLNEREKQLIRLRHIDGMDYEDIALILGMKEAAVRTALSRALQHLAELAKAIERSELI